MSLWFLGTCLVAPPARPAGAGCPAIYVGNQRGCSAGWVLMIFVSDLSFLPAWINPTRDCCFNFFVGYGFKFLQLALAFIQLNFKLC